MELPHGQDRLGSIYTVPLMLFFVAVGLFIALLQRQQELTILCLVTLSVFCGAYAWSRCSLRAVRFDLTTGVIRLFPEEKLPLSLEVSNAKALPIHLSVSPFLSGALAGEDGRQPEWRSGGMLGYQKASFRWTLTAVRRGVHAVGPVTAATGDPFGFFPRQTRIPCRREILVYPMIAHVKTFPAPRRDAFGAPGARGHVRDPVHVSGTRDYQPSDPARLIHWKASVRLGKLQTKVIAPTRQEKTLLLLDAAGFGGDSADEAFEEILEVIAGIALQKDRQGQGVGFATNAQLHGRGRAVLAPARNPGQMALILEALARVVRASRGDLVEVLRSGLDIPWGTGCVLFTSAVDRNAELMREFLLRRHTPLRVVDPHEAAALRDDREP